MTKRKDDKLSKQVVTEFKVHINNYLKDEEFKSLYLVFFEDIYSQQIFKASDRFTVTKYFKDYLITIFKNHSVKSISWEQYCISMKCIRVQKWENENSYGQKRIQKLARKMLSDFYNFILENESDNPKNISEIKPFKEFLIWEERNSSKMNYFLSDNILDKIGTNFPLESSPEQLHLIKCDEKSSPVILNLNINIVEIKNLLIGFYKNVSNGKKYNSIRQFIYLFRYSLLAVEKEPQSITDFSFDVFKKQYRFYQKTNIINPSVSTKFSNHLIHFYIYLCKIIKEQNIQHNIFNGTPYNANTLGNIAFGPHYEKGYRLITYNPLEVVPSQNRWLLIPSDSYASSRKKMPFRIDFLKVKDKFLRNDLKSYIWHQSSKSIDSVATGMYSIIEFLNFSFTYNLSNKKQINYFTADLLEQWRLFIGSKPATTANNYIKGCKSYLTFYRDKYQIPQLLINSLSQRPIDFDGGNPMTKHDITLFAKKFTELKNEGITGELCYIIFNLAATSKLRLGEISALERSCIIETSDETGIIRYHTKTTGNQKMDLILPIEKINLIKEAIKITENIQSKANKDIAKFIFLKEDQHRKDRIIEFSATFEKNFRKIQKELKEQLEGKYRPYDLRSTFIDNLYIEGLTDRLPTSLIAELAGNGEHTARRYYRKKTETQDYAEMFAGVTISGVDIYGNFLIEKEVEKLNPVENGLGGCKLKGCIDDEEEYECLICHHFATTTNRINIFKKRITKLNKLKESTESLQEQNKIIALIKLHTAYYVKLLDKIGGEEN
ncbi:site-specific integrase [Psychrobacillus antarcticus]|uniref:site-specific integrase n=1 Tax=Psychrobacillus antarcticus TaxID=2879115 RepID=UPI0024086474|nr:site-specific integrase [Psychrobacillus antarcticus]